MSNLELLITRYKQELLNAMITCNTKQEVIQATKKLELLEGEIDSQLIIQLQNLL